MEIGGRFSFGRSCCEVWKRSVSRDNQTQHSAGSDHDNHSCHCSCFSSDQAKSCRETELEASLGHRCNISANYLFLKVSVLA